MVKPQDNSIIALDKFIQSTRDSGYKNTGSAIAELVDNALQADASRIDVVIQDSGDDSAWPIRIAVADNGNGMDATLLRLAMRFGGSSRFNDRSGLGRYGMGLPNASLSQARRLTVFTWQAGMFALATYLDVDEIVAGEMVEVPEPARRAIPDWVPDIEGRSGTTVVWEQCDRLDHRRVSTISRKLHESLGRMFRYFIWEGLRLRINGEVVQPIDPLFVREQSRFSGAQVFQDVCTFEIYANPDNPRAGSGKVAVMFSELPVSEWQELSNEEKRRIGISNGAGVSIVRGGREVDFGWFFMGGKRRENYDDWWRCEIRFEPILDEAFGITHTKQQVRPSDFLVEVLQPHIETVAKALNARARNAHLQVKTGKITINAELVASDRDDRLKPLPRQSALAQDTKTLRDLIKRNATLKAVPLEPRNGKTHYRLIEDDSGGSIFFRPVLGEGVVLGVINPKHRFFKHLYQPVLESRTPEAEQVARAIQLLLLAAARAEGMFTRKDEHQAVERFRREWSEALDVMLGSR
jgi:hypothetical protein